MPSTRSRYLTPCFLVTLIVFALLGLTARASAEPLLPPGKQVFFGVSDTGDAEGFRSFARAVGKRPAVIQTFHPWGNSLNQALPRWRSIRARPMLHITTKEDDGTEIITPRGIAYGGGDDYLLRLNSVLARQDVRTYIRPMGEPNRCRNPYAGVDCLGNVRGGPYAFKWYRLAFRRIAVITRGGSRRGKVDARLSRLGMPEIQRLTANRLPRRLPSARVALVWSPLPAGSPTVRVNRPQKYWPGSEWVDWVATDFYSRYNNWKHLKRFYTKWSKRKNMPMAITEWGLWGEDSPRFVNRLFRFVHSRELVRMMVYYQDFAVPNPFRIQGFPRSLGALRRQVAKPVFPRFAPRFPVPKVQPPQPEPPVFQPDPGGGISPD
jgi:hypothetical protein